MDELESFLVEITNEGHEIQGNLNLATSFFFVTAEKVLQSNITL